MYTVKQVAGLTGVPQATLRAWERRYAIVEPSRSEGGYRLYDESQVAILREMAALVDAGVPASRAAATLRGGKPRKESERPAPDVVDSIVELAASLDSHRLHGCVEQLMARGTFEEFADNWLPAHIKEVGDAWESGRLNVAEEHFFSASLMRVMAAVFDAAGPPTVPGQVLVGLPPGGRHELMLFSYAICLRRMGVDVVYLGADVPTPAWALAARRHRARAAVVGVTSEQDGATAQRVIDHLAEVRPPVSLWVGGSQRGLVTGASHLPDEPSVAAGLLHRSLIAGRA